MPARKVNDLELVVWIGDKVVVDNDPSITGVVIGIEIRTADVIRYEVSWFCNGDVKICMFDDWRLSTPQGSK